MPFNRGPVVLRTKEPLTQLWHSHGALGLRQGGESTAAICISKTCSFSSNENGVSDSAVDTPVEFVGLGVVELVRLGVVELVVGLGVVELVEEFPVNEVKPDEFDELIKVEDGDGVEGGRSISYGMLLIKDTTCLGSTPLGHDLSTPAHAA